MQNLNDIHCLAQMDPGLAALVGCVIGVAITKAYNVARRMLMYGIGHEDNFKAAFRYYDPYYGTPSRNNPFMH